MQPSFSADYWVKHFQMQAHPEGGYFVETYRAHETIPVEALPSRFKGTRNFATGILFLLENHHFSAFHRIQADEMWHFYAGGSLNIYVIHPSGQLETIVLGNNPSQGEVFQAVVPAGCWFASRPHATSAYSLVGCTVAPGFDFADFELANRATLSLLYPAHQALIEQLTYA